MPAAKKFIVRNTGTRRITLDLSTPKKDGKGVAPRQLRLGSGALDANTKDAEPAFVELTEAELEQLRQTGGWKDLTEGSERVLTVRAA